MKDSTVEIAKELFSKNIPFCLYRFPSEKILRLAIDKNMVPHPEEKEFWMAPFCEQSKATIIHLAVLKEEFHSEAFLQQIKSMTPWMQSWCQLPGETSKATYLNEIESFLKDIRSEKLMKAVLSRVIHRHKSKDFNPFDCFLRLAQSYPNTFVHFSLHPESGIWMGATPELLLKKQGKKISIMALAGTQARKAKGDYHWRGKEMEEHLMVGRHIEAIFQQQQCFLAKKNGPKTIESGSVAHLKTDYLFEEKATVSLKSLLKILHPTPAVGGLPIKEGLDCILEHEGYDRTYYCGFIGEVEQDASAALYVNLRCMQVGQETIAVYVGGGITAASDPEEEWQETILKSKTMLEQIDPIIS